MASIKRKLRLALARVNKDGDMGGAWALGYATALEDVLEVMDGKVPLRRGYWKEPEKKADPAPALRGGLTAKEK